jgi:hypothetical protein
VPVDGAGPLVGRRSGVLLQKEEHGEIGLEPFCLRAELLGKEGEVSLIGGAFVVQGLACVGDLMVVMEVFDGLFEDDGDEQAEDDGRCG